MHARAARTPDASAHPVPSGTIRQGFTLIEMLIVVVVIGILIGISVPRVAAALARRDVSGAISSFESFYREARTAALQRREATTIRINAGVAVMTVSPGGVLDTIGRPLNFTTEFGLTPTTTATTLRIEPTGLILTGTPFTVIAQKRGVADTVAIIGLGRIQ